MLSFSGSSITRLDQLSFGYIQQRACRCHRCHRNKITKRQWLQSTMFATSALQSFARLQFCIVHRRHNGNTAVLGVCFLVIASDSSCVLTADIIILFTTRRHHLSQTCPTLHDTSLPLCSYRCFSLIITWAWEKSHFVLQAHHQIWIKALASMDGDSQKYI